MDAVPIEMTAFMEGLQSRLEIYHLWIDELLEEVDEAQCQLHALNDRFSTPTTQPSDEKVTPVDRAICKAYELVFAQNEKVNTLYYAIADVLKHDKRRIANIVRDFSERFPDEVGFVYDAFEMDVMMAENRVDRVWDKLFRLRNRCQGLFPSITLSW